MVTYFIAVVLVIIVLVVIIVVVIAIDGIVFVAVVIVVVVVVVGPQAIWIWPVKLGFIVGMRSDRNNMLHLAGRRFHHEVASTLRHIVSYGCR
jgi:hypothetical protein